MRVCKESAFSRQKTWLSHTQNTLTHARTQRRETDLKFSEHSIARTNACPLTAATRTPECQHLSDLSHYSKNSFFLENHLNKTKRFQEMQILENPKAFQEPQKLPKNSKDTKIPLHSKQLFSCSLGPWVFFFLPISFSSFTFSLSPLSI